MTTLRLWKVWFHARGDVQGWDWVEIRAESKRAAAAAVLHWADMPDDDLLDRRVELVSEKSAAEVAAMFVSPKLKPAA